ncbi:hypothetical protein FRC01_010963, partial [Tulasnella sp. 417]
QRETRKLHQHYEDILDSTIVDSLLTLQPRTPFVPKALQRTAIYAKRRFPEGIITINFESKIQTDKDTWIIEIDGLNTTHKQLILHIFPKASFSFTQTTVIVPYTPIKVQIAKLDKYLPIDYLFYQRK